MFFAGPIGSENFHTNPFQKILVHLLGGFANQPRRKKTYTKYIVFAYLRRKGFPENDKNTKNKKTKNKKHNETPPKNHHLVINFCFKIVFGRFWSFSPRAVFIRTLMEKTAFH